MPVPTNVQRGPLMLVYLTDIRGERVVIHPRELDRLTRGGLPIVSPTQPMCWMLATAVSLPVPTYSRTKSSRDLSSAFHGRNVFG